MFIRLLRSRLLALPTAPRGPPFGRRAVALIRSNALTLGFANSAEITIRHGGARHGHLKMTGSSPGMTISQFHSSPSVLRRPGGYVEVSEPDPIPNSVVKRLRADGTSS
jgi:hypothetical protein